MAILCQLAEPDSYQVSQWNLADDPEVAAYWLNLFATFSDRFDKHLLEDGLAGLDFAQRWPAFREEYARGIEAIRARMQATGSLYTIDLCRYRQSLLDKHGFSDPYLGVKRRENAMAARIYPDVIGRLDRADEDERWMLLLRGLLAGNMFDLGSPETIAMYQRGQVDFFAFEEHVPARPWFIDGADELVAKARSPHRWRQALFFVDNAGADIVLGVIPIARELARLGCRVVLAANSGPALNDITIAELDPLLDQLAAVDETLAALRKADRLATVASGCREPLIDLSRVTDACNAEASGSDLVLLQGMGRGVESNWHEPFRCDALRVAMLKDHTVVKWRGAKLFDAVCRFEETGSS